MGVLGEQVSVHLLTDGERGGVGGVSTQEVTEQRRGWKLGAVSKCSPTQYGGTLGSFRPPSQRPLFLTLGSGA